jgi:hypothetical protein
MWHGGHAVKKLMIVLSAMTLSITIYAGISRPQQDQPLAPDGRGLLPKPATIPATLQGTSSPHPFEPDPSGGFSRTVFETDEDPNFKLSIRDFSFPPDRQTHTITLSSAAFLHTFGEQTEISIAKKRVALSPLVRTVVPAGAPIDVVNNGEQAVVVRVLIVEAK